VGSFCLFKPNIFFDSVKIKTEDGFLRGVFPIELFEFLLGDRSVRIDIISREYIMYSGHSACANMTELLTKCQDDKANKVVNMYFKKVAKNPDQFVPLG
jgi:hypothetical protein